MYLHLTLFATKNRLAMSRRLKNSQSTFLSHTSTESNFAYSNLILLLHRQRELEKRIRSLEQTLNRSRRVVNQLFVSFHADVPEKTATSVRCSVWRSSSASFSNGVRSSSSHTALEMRSPRGDCTTGCVSSVMPRPAALLALLWLARRQLAQRLHRLGHRRLVQQPPVRRRAAAVLVLFCHLLHISCRITFLRNIFVFPLEDYVACDFRSLIAFVRVDFVNFDVGGFILVDHIDVVSRKRTGSLAVLIFCNHDDFVMGVFNIHLFSLLISFDNQCFLFVSRRWQHKWLGRIRFQMLQPSWTRYQLKRCTCSI